ncbi:hypothetical protein [Winogradskyella ouciana]|uniref:hypothetical protein n=1 Tax=Winogradskyella ouciana TaxID=2608631 RepID=UPI003D285D3A
MNNIFIIIGGVLAICLLYFFIDRRVKQKHNDNLIIPMWILMSFVALLGIVFIVIGALLDNDFFPVSTSWKSEYKVLIIGILNNLGQALFVGGLIGILFEMGSVKRYFEQRISDILINDEYLKFQHHKELMRLRQRATKNIYAQKSMDVDKDLIELDKEICDALTEPYFDFFQEASTCRLSDDNKYIIKTVRNRFKLINPSVKKANFLDVYTPKVRFKNIEGLEDSEIRNISAFEISVDGQALNSIIDIIKLKFSNDSKNGEDGYTITTELEFLNINKNLTNNSLSFNNTFTAKIIEERKIPLDDLNYSFRIDSLVKNFKFSLVFENDDTELVGNIYGTMSNPRDGIFIDKDSNSISIESKKWMLKGNGGYISIVPKNWKLVK